MPATHDCNRPNGKWQCLSSIGPQSFDALEQNPETQAKISFAMYEYIMFFEHLQLSENPKQINEHSTGLLMSWGCGVMIKHSAPGQ